MAGQDNLVQGCPADGGRAGGGPTQRPLGDDSLGTRRKYLGLPPISEQAKLLADVGRLWMGLGLWSLLSLRPSDMGRRQCTSGAYH